KPVLSGGARRPAPVACPPPSLEAPAVARSLRLIVNPAAGGGGAVAIAAAAAAELDALGADYETTPSASLGHARELATAAVAGGAVAVAVGGDGMAGALAGAVAGA